MCTSSGISERRAHGFSLVEAVVFIVIVSTALVGVLSVMNATTQRSADPLVRKQAIAVAESMLEEVSLHVFAITGAPVAPTQANRQSFDDIADYDGFATTGIFPIDSTALIPGLSGYNLAVTVAAAAFGPTGLTVPAANARLITVTVNGPDGVNVVLAGYRTAYGP